MDDRAGRAVLEAFAGLAAASAAVLSTQGHLAAAGGFLAEWLPRGDAAGAFRSPSWERLREMQPRAGEGHCWRGALTLAGPRGEDQAVNGTLWRRDGGFLLVVERRPEAAGPARPVTLAEEFAGLGNAGSFDHTLEGEIERVQRYGGSLCLVLAAIDGLDGVSHRSGDEKAGEVLRAFARVVCNATRKSDRVCHVGEERFMIMLPNAPLGRAAAITDRIRAAFSAALPEAMDSVSPSFGNAAWREGEDAASLVGRVDRALGAARAAGGGRAESA